jgi:aldose 1-epimerase
MRVESGTMTAPATLSVHVDQAGAIKLITLGNGRVTVKLTNMGCSIVAVHTPGKDGQHANIVAGFDSLVDYTINKDYYGCTVGRFANRIANGRFMLDGITYTLPVNNGPNHLHGGLQGFSHKLWTFTGTIETADTCGAVFTYTSADGEEAYPGTVAVTVTFLLNMDNQLSIQYQATSTRATPLNLTNHTYFNLSGFKQPTIHEHQLWLNAAYYTPKNENNIPTGVIAPVQETVFDFTTAKKLGTDLQLLKTDKGYDHNFVINPGHNRYTKAAILTHEESGRSVTVYTDKPGIQVYTANFWDGTTIGEQGIPYQQHGAVALETQYFPDSPNQANFPSCITAPGQVYAFTTIFEFTVL